MLSNLVCIPLILKTLPNDDIRKNDSQQLQILVNSNKELIKIPVNNINLKENIKKEINKIINTSNFHLEQVYTLGEDEYITDGKIDIIYLAVTNIENIKDLKEEYPNELMINRLLDKGLIFEKENQEYDIIR